MARKKEPEGEQNFERWLLPYADMITLLLAFFIIMYALTLMEKAKADKIMAEIAKAMGGSGASKGTPNMVSGGKTFPNPVIKNDGEFKSGTNKKIKFLEDSGKNPTLGPQMDEDEYKRFQQFSDIDLKKFIPGSSEAGKEGKGISSGGTEDKPKFRAVPEEIFKASAEVFVSESEYNEMQRKFGGNFRGDKELAAVMDRLKDIFGGETKHGTLEIKLTNRGVEMKVSGDLLFGLGSAELLPQSYDLLKRMGAALIGVRRLGFNFRVEGHSDSINVHSFLYPSNWELSTARAVSVVRFLVEEVGLEPTAIAAAGYGMYQPVATNATVEGRRMNRRIEIIIYDPIRPTDITENLRSSKFNLNKALTQPAAGSTSEVGAGKKPR